MGKCLHPRETNSGGVLGRSLSCRKVVYWKETLKKRGGKRGHSFQDDFV